MWSQILTLIGVLLGASMSYLFTWRLERTRNLREMTIRWDIRKYEAYSEYLVTVTQMARTAGQLVHTRGWDDLASSIDQETGIANLDRFEGARTAAYERVVMLADEESIRAADDLNRAVWRLEWMARGATEGSLQDWQALLGIYIRALDHFQQAARSSLVVPLATFVRRIERPEASAKGQPEDDESPGRPTTPGRGLGVPRSAWGLLRGRRDRTL
jgi:hypothetical protein